MSRRRPQRKTSRLATPIAIGSGCASLIGCAVIVVLMIQGSGSPDTGRLWAFGLVSSLIVSVVVAVVVSVMAGKVGTRVNDLGLAVAKIGRGGAGDVRVRVGGEDELGGLARKVQYLASDIGALVAEIDQGGGQAASRDPQARAYRDKTLDEPFGRPPEGFEADGAITAGDRGGLDYFGCVSNENRSVVYTVAGEGSGPMAVVAGRIARDEIARALEAGRSARQALAHANKRMHDRLPRGSCARATLLEMSDGNAKLYQAGDKTPMWICSAGEVLEINSDGLALGLDDGPVFEKGLRSQTLDPSQGTRYVITNDAGVRMQDLLDLVSEHAPKHTAPFMNLVLGAIEAEAGSDGLREDLVLVTVKKSA